MSLPIVVAEVAKILLQGYFSYLRQQGATPEQIDQLYSEEKAQFEANNPDDIPDV